ncbi:hypothetical protein LCGC14_1576410 [marine sediment metagenome]|uniref:Uncharacterized protein n=1 Tax=marine sediment metagenome TaxID=412755 RepID=A0A0F9II62_9ZZZZ
MPNGRIDDTLQEVAAQLQQAKETLPDAITLVEILEEAGEDASEVRALIVETRTRILQWERTLQRRGVTLPSAEPETEE